MKPAFKCFIFLILLFQLFLSGCGKEVAEANPDFVGTWIEEDAVGNEELQIVIGEDSEAYYYRFERYPAGILHLLASGMARIGKKNLTIGDKSFSIDKKPTPLGAQNWTMTLDGVDYVGSGPRPKGEYCDDGIQNQQETGIDCGDTCGSCFESCQFEVEGEGVYNIRKQLSATYYKDYDPIDPRNDHERFTFQLQNKIYSSSDIEVALILDFIVLPDNSIIMNFPSQEIKTVFLWTKDFEYRTYKYESGHIVITHHDVANRTVSVSFDLIFKDTVSNTYKKIKNGQIKNVQY